MYPDNSLSLRIKSNQSLQDAVAFRTDFLSKYENMMHKISLGRTSILNEFTAPESCIFIVFLHLALDLLFQSEKINQRNN